MQILGLISNSTGVRGNRNLLSYTSCSRHGSTAFFWTWILIATYIARLEYLKSSNFCFLLGKDRTGHLALSFVKGSGPRLSQPSAPSTFEPTDWKLNVVTFASCQHTNCTQLGNAASLLFHSQRGALRWIPHAHWKVCRATCKFGESSPESYPNSFRSFSIRGGNSLLSFETLQQVATYRLQGPGATNDLRLRRLFCDHIPQPST